MDNLLASTEVGTIFLDRQLRIRKFTPQIAETFNLLPHDVGRSIETFAHKMDHPELVEDLKQRARDRAARSSASCATSTGESFFLRILPYRAKGDGRRRRAHADRRERAEGRRGRAVPRALPAEQPARERPGRDLLQGRARALHSRQPRDGRRGSASAIPRRRGGQDRARAARTRRPRWRCTGRTRPCCARARRSTTSSRSAAGPDERRRVGPGDAAAAARSRRADRRRHRRSSAT